MKNLQAQTGMLAASITGLLVGATMVATTAVSADVTSGTLALLRYVIGAAVIVVPLALIKPPRFSAADTGAIMLIGIFQFAVLMLLLNYALARLDATTCALVFSTMPLFTMGWSIAVRQETFRAVKLVGILLAGGGIALLLGMPSKPIDGEGLLGFAALIVATLIGAVTSVLHGPYLARYSALHTSGLAMVAAVIFLTLYCWATAQPFVPCISSAQWANVYFIGISSGFGYYCWLHALERLEPSRVVAFQALGPVTASTIEMVMGSRFLTLELAAALVVVSAGLILIMRQ